MQADAPSALDVSKTLAILLAGGQGTRLYELTRNECKPALHFAGGHRIVDFTVANALRSGLSSLLVATQYMPGTLSRHLMQVWAPSFRGNGIILRNGPDLSPEGYVGTAAAISANAPLVDGLGVDEVLILSGDHIYGMDYRPMIAHHRASGAGITMAALPVGLSEASGFGIIAEGPDGRIAGFAEKPRTPVAMPSDKTRALASLGIYVARWDWLRSVLAGGLLHDFGHDVLPLAVAQGDAGVWRWDGAGEAPYWRDVGTLDAFREAWVDYEVRPRPFPRPVAPDAAPPIPPAPNAGTSRFSGRLGGGGVQILAPRLRATEPGRWTVLDGTVMMPGSRVAPGVRLTNVIVASGTSVPEGLVIGEDPDEDARWFRRTGSGTVLVTTQMLARRAAERMPPISLQAGIRSLLRLSR